MELSNIKSVFVHWSESNLINKEMGHDENSDIEKEIEPAVFDDLVRRSAAEVGPGYDKTVLTVHYNDGTKPDIEIKFYLTPEKDSLLKLINEA